MARGFFITLEGPDGCGKTTQTNLLARALQAQGLNPVVTREPGGTKFAEELRGVLLNPDYHVSPMTELMLFETIRAHHTDDLIGPALKAGKLVICDRYADSTVAYQGYGRMMDLKVIEQLNRLATGGLKPDLTLALDIPAAEGLRRVREGKGRGATDRMEREAASFHERVRKGFRAIARREPRRVKMVDASGSVDEVHERILKRIEQGLKRK